MRSARVLTRRCTLRPSASLRRCACCRFGSKRRFAPNLQHAHLHSDALGQSVHIRVTTRALRTVQKRGGLDAYLVGTDDAKLPPEALVLKRQVLKALH